METMAFAQKEAMRLMKSLNLPSDYRFRLTVQPDLVGEPALDDRYLIDSDRQEARVTGSNARSVLQGVYRFFYHLGVRYMGPGREYEQFPQMVDEARLIWQEDVRPAYRHRGVCIEGADSVENIISMIDWLPKIGMNAFFVQFRQPDTFMERWYLHERNPLMFEEIWNPEIAEAYNQGIDAVIRERGIMHHRVGHGWTGAVLGSTASGWNEEAELPEEQRALCAEVNGIRGYFHGIPVNTNLCYSSPDVRNRLKHEVVSYAKAHPEVQDLHLWLADGFNNHCECSACRAKTPTDHYIVLLNEIDEALSNEGLETKIVFLLYQELLWPPVTERLHHPERFVMMFAPISRSFEHTYSEMGDLPEIPAFHLNQIALPASVEENTAFLKAWQKVYDGDSFDYDYHLGRAHYGDPGYVHISRVLAKDIRELGTLGLNGMITCQELRAGFPNFLPNYIMGRFLTDPTLDFDAEVQDYIAHAYGADSEAVLAYLSALSTLTDCDYFNGRGPRYRPDLAEAYQQALDLVLQKRDWIENRDLNTRFDLVLAYHSLYCEAYLRTLLSLMQKDQEELKVQLEALNSLADGHEADFQAELDVYRLHEVMEHYTLPERMPG